METANITDYRMINPKLAKVIISYTGNVDATFIGDTIAKKLNYLGAPVKSSFKKIRDGVAVGFVRANTAIRVISKGDKPKYRMMTASNMVMDNSDKSLWEVRTSEAGKYLVRHGEDDLSDLIQASKHSRTDIPRISQITIARAAKRELVAFVDEAGDLDHGFVLNTSDSSTKVLSVARNIPVVVGYDSVVSIYPISIPKATHAKVMAGLTPEQKRDEKEYFRKLYSYDRDYLADVLRNVNETTVL